MIVNCPTCNKAYSLPPSIVASPSVKMNLPLPQQQYGWSLSCANCNYQWWQPAKSNFPPNNRQTFTESSPSPSFPQSFKSAERSTQTIGRKKSGILSLVSLLIIALSVGCVGYLYRQPLKSIWYQFIGKPFAYASYPLILQNVHYNLSHAPNPSDDSQVLTIEGIIFNPNTFIMEAPVLRVSVWENCQGNPAETKSSFNDCLYLEWLYRPTAPQIDALGAITFQTSYPISSKITRVEVSIP